MLKTFSITDIGRKRNINQDYIYTSEEPVGNLPNVFIVADGMGGHNAGDYASKVTVETMIHEMENSFEKNPSLIFRKAIEEANTVIRKRASEDKKLEGMGTTVVAASCMGRFLQVANVGDSRLYVVGSKIRQITRDHSYVEEWCASENWTVRTPGIILRKILLPGQWERKITWNRTFLPWNCRRVTSS